MYAYDNTSNNLLKINPYNGSTTSIQLPVGYENAIFGYSTYNSMQYSVHEGDMYFFTANTMSMGTRMLKINTQDEISEIESDGSITSRRFVNDNVVSPSKIYIAIEGKSELAHTLNGSSLALGRQCV